MKKQINLRNSALVLVIVLAGCCRIFMSTAYYSPLHNFTPIGAMAIFSGFYFKNNWKAFLVPIITLWLSDLFLNYFVYYHQWKWIYDGFYFTYGSFLLAILIGRTMVAPTPKNVLFSGVSAALLHWIITDFGVWATGTMYPLNFTGFVACYVMAIPYLKYMVISNVFFGAILFGLFELAQKKFMFISAQEPNKI